MNPNSTMTKLIIDLEDILAPFNELDYEAVGMLRAAATKKGQTKVLVINIDGVEIERTTRERL